MRKLLVSLLITFISCFVLAQKSAQTTHIVEKGETLYSISRKYHVTLEAIENANKSSIGGNFKLKIGQKLTIPTSAATTSAPRTEKPAATVSQSHAQPRSYEPVPSGGSRQALHIVEKGETGYAIAKANGLTWQQLQEANNLPEDAKLQPGQRLIIPSRNVEAVYKPAPKAVKTTTPAHSTHTKATPEPPQDQAVYIPPDERNEPAKPSASVPAAAQPVKTDKPVENKTDENPFLPRPAEEAKPAPPNAIKNENVNPDDYVAVFSGYNDSGKKKITYRGIGMFMQVENPGNQFLALYNYADMGSILKVTNLMSKEIVYVKVIGKVPATDTQKEVILKVSSEAAAKLKVSEDRFLVEVAGYNND